MDAQTELFPVNKLHQVEFLESIFNGVRSFQSASLRLILTVTQPVQRVRKFQRLREVGKGAKVAEDKD